jgi:hypothetical protein
MMIGAVPREIADARPVPALLGGGQPGAEVDRVGDPEAEQPAVEIERRVRVRQVHAEVPEPADAERPREPHAADIELRLIHACLLPLGLASWGVLILLSAEAQEDRC